MKIKVTNGIDSRMQKYCKKYLEIHAAAKYNDDPSTQKQLQARSQSFQWKSIFLQENQCTPILQKRSTNKLESNHKIEKMKCKATHENHNDPERCKNELPELKLIWERDGVTPQ